MTPGIVAAIVTHRRPGELRRLLASLAHSTLPLAGCIISDHAPAEETARLAADAPFPVHVLNDAGNPGPGVGWAHAATAAFDHFGDNVQAILFLDDDVMIPPDALEILWQQRTAAQADAIAPLLEDAEGRLWSFPEPEAAPLRKLIRKAKTPADARRMLGEAPLPFCWCTGASFLVTAPMIKRVGLHRADFWMLGEDLEYSMRIASAGKAVFTCLTSIPHLPPTGGNATAKSNYVKFCSLLQNLSYLSYHADHSGHMVHYLPGNFRRFFRTYGLKDRTIIDAWKCFWNGGFAAEPSGGKRGQAFRQHLAKIQHRA